MGRGSDGSAFRYFNIVNSIDLLSIFFSFFKNFFFHRVLLSLSTWGRTYLISLVSRCSNILFWFHLVCLENASLGFILLLLSFIYTLLFLSPFLFLFFSSFRRRYTLEGGHQGSSKAQERITIWRRISDLLFFFFFNFLYPFSSFLHLEFPGRNYIKPLASIELYCHRWALRREPPTNTTLLSFHSVYFSNHIFFYLFFSFFSFFSFTTKTGWYERQETKIGVSFTPPHWGTFLFFLFSHPIFLLASYGGFRLDIYPILGLDRGNAGGHIVGMTGKYEWIPTNNSLFFDLREIPTSSPDTQKRGGGSRKKNPLPLFILLVEEAIVCCEASFSNSY